MNSLELFSSKFEVNRTEARKGHSFHIFHLASPILYLASHIFYLTYRIPHFPSHTSHFCLVYRFFLISHLALFMSQLVFSITHVAILSRT